MDEKTEQEGLKYLKEIEEEVSELKLQTPTPRRAFLNGIMQGMGAIIGSIFAIMVLGWILSLFGFIPGLKEVAEYIQEVSSRIR